ncbi:LacI family transcriptional regulator [Flagellimonas onchidii]|uniref:LacI family transcriptional regulator n=1 Tax=Flagellimonas onchidii TaxID=2562684 RepID=UPI0010A69904|nr:LacI family transcriptional regulator [Allomuricauda onchidii]
MAQDFRNKQSKVLAVVVPDLRHYFFVRFVSDFMEVAQDEGYSIIIFQSGKNQMLKSKLSLVAKVIASVINDNIHGS